MKIFGAPASVVGAGVELGRDARTVRKEGRAGLYRERAANLGERTGFGLRGSTPERQAKIKESGKWARIKRAIERVASVLDAFPNAVVQVALRITANRAAASRLLTLVENQAQKEDLSQERAIQAIVEQAADDPNVAKTVLRGVQALAELEALGEEGQYGDIDVYGAAGARGLGSLLDNQVDPGHDGDSFRELHAVFRANSQDMRQSFSGQDKSAALKVLDQLHEVDTTSQAQWRVVAALAGSAAARFITLEAQRALIKEIFADKEGAQDLERVDEQAEVPPTQASHTATLEPTAAAPPTATTTPAITATPEPTEGFSNTPTSTPRPTTTATLEPTAAAPQQPDVSSAVWQRPNEVPQPRTAAEQARRLEEQLRQGPEPAGATSDTGSVVPNQPPATPGSTARPTSATGPIAEPATPATTSPEPEDIIGTEEPWTANRSLWDHTRDVLTEHDLTKAAGQELTDPIKDVSKALNRLGGHQVNWESLNPQARFATFTGTSLTDLADLPSDFTGAVLSDQAMVKLAEFGKDVLNDKPGLDPAAAKIFKDLIAGRLLSEDMTPEQVNKMLEIANQP
ncbi:MAG: hypothetical protein GF390_04040 [Candidatus Pacebacteria bacterium]|nr:hypothetical protein [Candidatus Paceibacterota bacterium]